MSYRLLAPVYDWVAPRISRYRSPALLTSKVQQLAPDGCELLDVGIGTGLSIAPYVGSPRFKRIVGIEPSSAMLARCRRKYPDVELHAGTLEEVGRGTVAALLKPAGWFVFTYEPELLFTLRQARNAPHIGTYGRAAVFRRMSHEVDRVLRSAGLAAREDVEFKAYLGLIHHLVVAGTA